MAGVTMLEDAVAGEEVNGVRLVGEPPEGAIVGVEETTVPPADGSNLAT